MRISDWSSDVCSSDLLGHLHWSHPALVADLILPAKASGSARIQRYFGELVGLIALVQPDQEWATNEFQALLEANAPLHAVHGAIESAVNVWRSEERRVGKECCSTCRFRWSRYH